MEELRSTRWHLMIDSGRGWSGYFTGKPVPEEIIGEKDYDACFYEDDKLAYSGKITITSIEPQADPAQRCLEWRRYFFVGIGELVPENANKAD